MIFRNLKQHDREDQDGAASNALSRCGVDFSAVCLYQARCLISSVTAERYVKHEVNLLQIDLFHISMIY